MLKSWHYCQNVTGDNKITAMAIAKECNIINANSGIDNDSVL